MEKLFAWFSQLNFDTLLETAILVAASLLCITFHETCHGFCAYLLGDRTAKNMGRLTLNPIKHVDVFGLIVMAVAHFGWAKPVPVDMRNFKNPKAGMALTALAGPVSNVVLAFFAMLLFAAVYAFYAVYAMSWLSYVLMFLYYVEIISAGLAVFNLFPIPPLDGSKVLFSFLPDAAYLKLMKFERFGMILLAVLLFTNSLDALLIHLRDGLINFLHPLADWPFDLLINLLV